MAFKIEDVPIEVQKVWAVQSYCQSLRTGVGSKLYNECLEIIKKYPKWFPEENKALDKIKNEKMNPETIHRISEKVIQAKSKIEAIEYILQQLKDSKQVSACLELEFDSKRRTSRRYYLDREEVIPLMETRLIEAKEELIAFENDFKNYTK